MTQPQGFEVEEQGELVCKLERALYRLSNLDELVTQTYIDLNIATLGLHRGNADHNLYIGSPPPDSYTVLVLCEDDIMLTDNAAKGLQSVKESLTKEIQDVRLRACTQSSTYGYTSPTCKKD